MPDDRYRLTLTFEDRASYSYLLDPSEVTPHVRCGVWKHPFPNEPGDSFAFGVVEAAAQSDFVAPLLAAHGAVVAVTVERP